MMPNKTLFQTLAISGFKLVEKHGPMNSEALANTIKWDEDAIEWAELNGHEAVLIEALAPKVAAWVLKRLEQQELTPEQEQEFKDHFRDLLK
jgi:hypothetical protein